MRLNILAGLLPTFILCTAGHGATPLGPRRADVAFTLNSFRKGDLDSRCKATVEKARKQGFTAINFCPSFAFDSRRGVIPYSTTNPGEMARCLDEAWKAGLAIVYDPHLESLATLNDDHEHGWRAEFDFHPDKVYRSAVFDEVVAWIESHADEIGQSDRMIHINVSAELEKSTSKYPAEWADLLTGLKRRLALPALAGRIQVGFNPNWNPPIDPTSAECENYRKYVKVADYIGPSIYGDWSQTELGSKQVDDQIAEALRRMTRHRARRWYQYLTFWKLFDGRCRVPEFRKAPLLIGEISIGGKPTDSSVGKRIPTDPSARADYLDTRREIYANLMSWLSKQPCTSKPGFIAFWTLGVFDFAGLQPGPGDETVVDSKILDGIKAYTEGARVSCN